jgi:3-deoxy-manno-octulosonate cytidylyltransferase (CMP-KDO synthetase)
MNGFVVVIPARFASVRLPGKPLREIAGKPMLQHVYERATESGADQVIVATDDARIADAAGVFGAEVCMTSADHRSGTERLAEAARLLEWSPDRVVVNLQGDEPLMPPELIAQCAGLMAAGDAQIATLASELESIEEFRNPNVVKVLVDRFGQAIYFSRASIPYARSDSSSGLAMRCALRHHGIYAYRVDVLQQFVRAAPSPLEECEQLEQLRALANGLRIRVGRPTVRPGPGVDTEEDLQRVAALLENPTR